MATRGNNVRKRCRVQIIYRNNVYDEKMCLAETTANISIAVRLQVPCLMDYKKQ